MDEQAWLDKLVPGTLVNLERVYPNGVGHVMWDSAETDITPTTLHPAFYGCFDWHSAVHSQWQVVRALRRHPAAPFAAEARAVLNRLLTDANLAVELAYVARRPGFEMPYGMAWLLQLCAELRQWDDADGRRWLAALAPLEAHAAARFTAYCATRPLPVRSGTHNQSAFALGLALDWARSAGAAATAATLAETARRFYGADTAAPLAYEPSATDFLSPTLAAADLLCRVLPPPDLADWLDRFFGSAATLTAAPIVTPVAVVDAADGQLAHFAGLNLSRAWMLAAVAAALPPAHALVAPLRAAADRHRAAGLALADHPDYMISHWVPTFAVYLLTNRRQL